MIKNTMNKMDIARYHRMLKEGLTLSEISGNLLISVDALKKFDPETVNKFKASEKIKLDALISKVDSKTESIKSSKTDK